MPGCREAAFVVASASAVTVGFATRDSATKPKLRVSGDGFPFGQSTPEGAATDLARAFIQRNAVIFRTICIRPYGDGRVRADYVEYLAGASAHLTQRKGTVSPDDPRTITKVFAARHLSKGGPASYGYAAFEFKDVMFVDVEVALNSGERHVRRTMVIQDRDGKWYVHPVPDMSPLLNFGLEEESVSVKLFADIYEIEK